MLSFHETNRWHDLRFFVRRLGMTRIIRWHTDHSRWRDILRLRPVRETRRGPSRAGYI